MTIKGLSTIYNKGLQASVEPLIDHIMTLSDSIQMATGVLSTLTTQPDKVWEPLAPETLAIKFVDYLIRKGVLIREGYHISSRIMNLAEKEGVPLDQLSFKQLQSIDGRFEQGVQDCLDYDRAVELKDS